MHESALLLELAELCDRATLHGRSLLLSQGQAALNLSESRIRQALCKDLSRHITSQPLAVRVTRKLLLRPLQAHAVQRIRSVRLSHLVAWRQAVEVCVQGPEGRCGARLFGAVVVHALKTEFVLPAESIFGTGSTRRRRADVHSNASRLTTDRADGVRRA